MSKVDDLAYDIASELNGVGVQNAFDPTMIYTIVEIISQVLTILQDCRDTPAEAMEHAKKANVLDRAIVRWETRKVMGWRNYRRNGGAEIAARVLSKGQSLSQADWEELYQ